MASKSGQSPDSSLEWSSFPLARISKAPPPEGIESERRDALAEFKNLGRQTDGLRRVVSNDAVFDRDFGFHPELLSEERLSSGRNAVKTL